MSDVVIRVEGVSKKYCRSIKKSIVYGLADIGRNVVGLSSQPGRLRNDEFWAVDDISFEVERGQTLGLIGANGSGKTTLLKMLNGIFWPDKGKIAVRGRVGALIAVGAGFHPLLTGRENIYVNGAILGIGRKAISKQFDAIVEFSGIKDSLDTPVKFYSSGMFVRLGFAVAIHCEPEILLIDEVLAVGDIDFRAKCMRKLKELNSLGVTKIFVSHDMNAVLLICDKTIHLSRGKIRMHGPSRDVINQYKVEALRESDDDFMESHQIRYGTRQVEIKKVEFLDESSRPRELFKRGEFFRVRIAFEAKERVEKPNFSIGFYTQDGVLISKPITRDHQVQVESIEKEGAITYSIPALPFNVGKYFVSVGCWDSVGRVAYDHHEQLYDFIVEEGAVDGRIQERFGLVTIPGQWEIK